MSKDVDVEGERRRAVRARRRVRAAATAIILLVGMAATLVPSFRATRVDPAIAIRTE